MNDVDIEKVKELLGETNTTLIRLADELAFMNALLDPRRLTLDEAVRELADESPKVLRTEDSDESAGQPCPFCENGIRTTVGLNCNGTGQG